MPTKRFSSEQIITKLREAEVHLFQGMTDPLMCKKLKIHYHTYYKWRREYGGLRMDQTRSMKELEKENIRFWGNTAVTIIYQPVKSPPPPRLAVFAKDYNRIGKV